MTTSRGNAGASVPELLDVQQAAEVLNVSPAYVLELLAENAFPHEQAGAEPRIRREDLLAYKRKDTALRRRIADELTREAQKLGLY